MAVSRVSTHRTAFACVSLAVGLLSPSCQQQKIPELVWASSFGGSSTDDCDDIAVDGKGLLLLACHADSDDFASLQRIGAQTQAGMDAYVVKLDPVAGRIQWAVRIGGNGYDGTFRIRIDATDNVYATGYTESTDLPTTAEAIQPSFGGGAGDAFLVKITPDGRLVYASYFGGSGSDQATDIMIDTSSGRILLAGMTASPDLPGARNSHTGEEDGFLACFDPEQPGELEAFYVGGSKAEKVTAMASNGHDHVVLTGYTYSPDFPTSAPLQAQLPGKNSAFGVCTSLPTTPHLVVGRSACRVGVGPSLNRSWAQRSRPVVQAGRRAFPGDESVVD